MLDAEAHVAGGKVRVWWAIDHILLAEEDVRWMTRQVRWQGPLPTTRQP